MLHFLDCFAPAHIETKVHLSHIRGYFLGCTVMVPLCKITELVLFYSKITGKVLNKQTYTNGLCPFI